MCRNWIKCVADEENINGDVHVGEQCGNEEHGEYECIPDCDERIKPYLGQHFQTLDEGVRYYKEYTAFVGFDVRGSTMKNNRYGDVEVKYLLCSREGYTVTKAQSRVDGNIVVLKDDDAEMIPPKYIVQRWTKKGNAKETEAHTEDKDENKLVGKACETRTVKIGNGVNCSAVNPTCGVKRCGFHISEKALNLSDEFCSSLLRMM
nr:protein FAR1-RELATED SEQUENCE 5-like [Ipomoea batatas]